LGIQAGDRVLLLLENCAPVVAAFFACSRIGVAIIPLNARQSADEVTRVIEHAQPALILFTSVVSPDARQHATRFATQTLSGSFGEFAVCKRPSNPDALNDTAVILYTTGTTLEPRFSTEKLYAALCDGVTLLSAVPQMHAMLMQYLKEQGHESLPVNTLRYVSSGAAPLDPDWKRRAEAFYGVALQNGYGMTEATAGVCITRSEFGDPDISCGPPFPGVEVSLDFDALGAAQDVGEVLVRGDNVMSGYFRNDAATADAFNSEGWLRTGDLGSFDETGHLHIRGRSKELIIHGGFNVYPPEVEAVLSEHPQVILAAVIGEQKDGDEQVVAFVQAAADDLPDPEELRAFVAQRLTGYKRPSRIEVRTQLPSATTGKVLKHKLRALL